MCEMTTTNDLALASIEEIAPMIAAKKVSPVELTRAHA